MIKIWLFLLTLIIGIIIGVSGTFLAPELVSGYLPEAIKGRTIALEGNVLKKQKRQANLLLTINTDQGAMLATFRKKVEKIHLLVDQGDTIELVLRQYKPFVEDPQIKRVKKGQQEPAAQEYPPVQEFQQPVTREQQYPGVQEQPPLLQDEQHPVVQPEEHLLLPTRSDGVLLLPPQPEEEAPLNSGSDNDQGMITTKGETAGEDTATK